MMIKREHDSYTHDVCYIVYTTAGSILCVNTVVLSVIDVAENQRCLNGTRHSHI